MTGQDKTSEKSFYDNLFQRRRKFGQIDNSLYERIADQARRETQGRNALDLGCGSGELARCLLDRDFTVVATDLSYHAAQATRANLKNNDRILVCNSDAERLPLPDESIDACVCWMLFHHCKHLNPVAAELRRVVKPGGIVAAMDANARNPLVWNFFNVIHRVRPISGVTPNQRAITSKGIEHTFSRQGFGKFQFSSTETKLKRDRLGESIGASLNYQLRAALLALSGLMLPKISQGNMFISLFKRLHA